MTEREGPVGAQMHSLLERRRQGPAPSDVPAPAEEESKVVGLEGAPLDEDLLMPRGGDR